MNIFSEVKQALNIERVIQFYGFEIKRHNFICPFHNDTKPSAFIKNNYFNCFVCGAGGDVIKFVARLYGLSNFEACKKLIQDFNLNISINEPVTAWERLKAERERQKRLAIIKEREELDKLIFDTGLILAKYHCYLWERPDTIVSHSYLTQAEAHISAYDEDPKNYSLTHRKDVKELERRLYSWNNQGQ